MKNTYFWDNPVIMYSAFIITACLFALALLTSCGKTCLSPDEIYEMEMQCRDMMNPQENREDISLTKYCICRVYDKGTHESCLEKAMLPMDPVRFYQRDFDAEINGSAYDT